MNEIDYIGSELELFREAVHWKRYWSQTIAPFVGARVLDVGAGIGATASVLATRGYERWVELEPDAVQAREIERLRERGEIPSTYEVRVGTSDDLGDGERFDTILYMDVLEHIEDDRGELERAARHLERGGAIVVLAPAHQSLYTAFDRSIGHFRRYDRRSLAAITPLGCEIAFCRYLDSAGMLASLANRLLLRQAVPRLGQILFWDRVLVRSSLVLDPLTLGRLGKSIVCVFRKGLKT
jgi:2-polyprenyl-3-methyl-5-hydroxy-6-metoxy-1,4-benzoquinol methylase